MVAKSDIIFPMDRNHRKTLAAVITDPVSSNIEWRKIEALFKAAGCEVIEGSGSRIAVLWEGRRAAFKAAVDHYLVACTKLGDKPNKPYSGKLTLRIPRGVHADVATAAEISGKSLNKWVADVLNQATQTP